MASDARRRRPSPTGDAAVKASLRFRQRTETAREREVLQHLLQWGDMHDFEALKPVPTPAAAAPSATPEPTPCPDTTLLAFAQLAALRLHARRSFITLMTTHNAYVLAEATRTMSFQHQAVGEERDQLWIGSCCVPRDDDLTSLAIEEWSTARELRKSSHQPGHYYTESISQHWQIVSDLRSAPLYRDRAIVQAASWARFYFAVPLRSAQGSVIGAFSIIDDRPRWGIEAGEMSFMEDVADTIVEHLHATVVRAQRQRSERLIQALGLFNRGKDSLREWWLTQEDDRYANTGRHADEPMDPFAREARGDTEFGPRSPSANTDGGQEILDVDPIPQPPSTAVKTATSELNSSSGRRIPSARPKTFPRNASERKGRSSRKASRLDGFDVARAAEQTYLRASNLMREALAASGVAFVDARIVSPTSKRTHSEDSDERSSTSTSPSGAAQRRDSSEGDSSDADAKALCKVQGSSMRQAGEIDPTPISKRFDLPESYLRHLIKRYPKGHVFNFTEHGSLSAGSSGGEGENEAQLETNKTIQFYGSRLRDVVGGANTIAFYPIPEDNNEHWRSAVFAWSRSTFRMFDSIEDLTYLSTFGHSLVSELSRLETLAADQAKGKFISSISHELRSPLHGVLAGVEFLQETDLSLFQSEMAHTIQKAGQTLLDTVNHLLDFSKISNFSSAPKRKAARARESRHPDADPSEIGVSSAVNLAKLTEDLVESVVSAHRFEHASDPQANPPALFTSSKQPQQQSHSKRQQEAGNVSIVLKLAGRKDWAVELQPGSWTRVVTNLVGNALKYTARGSISVSLHAEDTDNDTEEDPSAQWVSLVVEDTGAGISEKFLNSHLYTPFEQEDSHSSGTGLGLSIVKQIAHDMGARLNLTSKVGRGTRVTFDLRLQFLPPSATTSPSLGQVTSYPGALNIGPGHLQLIEPAFADPLQPPTSAFQGLRASVFQMCREWLGREVVCSSRIDDADDATVFAISEEYACALAKKDPSALNGMLSAVHARGARLLVLGCAIRSMSLSGRGDGELDDAIFVHQPIGVQKLVRALNHAADPSHSEDENASDENSLMSGQSENNRPTSQSGNVREGLRSTSSKMPSRPGALRSIPQRSESEDSAIKGSPRIAVLSDEAPSLSNLEGCVMLVEDNSINMKLLTALMHKLNMKYECATNGREAVDMYRENPMQFPIILMDLSMPVMDGNQATAKIRELEKSRHLRRTVIVALTGLTDEDSRRRAYASGVDDFQTKPIHMKDLKKLLDSISL